MGVENAFPRPELGEAEHGVQHLVAGFQPERGGELGHPLHPAVQLLFRVEGGEGVPGAPGGKLQVQRQGIAGGEQKIS